MFLERKFSVCHGGGFGGYEPPLCPVLPRADWNEFPPIVYDVVSHIQLLLKARRGYDHLFLDYGLSPTEGSIGSEGVLERLQAELVQTLARYEPRFALSESEFNADDDGTIFLRITGRIRHVAGVFRLRFAIVARKIVDLDFQPDRNA